MGAKFWFFTDCDRLADQSPGEAFGPTLEAPATKFRVTDLHHCSAYAGAAVAPDDQARAYAICKGLLRAQLDDESGLTLILKPAGQPPFDFPFIAYYLYKGVDPASLLKGGSTWPLINVDNADDVPLLDRIDTDWTANGLPGSPTSKCLGLHLNSGEPTSAGFNPSLYASDQPLDNLFYQGDGRFPARLVHAGERIGNFLGDRFGLEIVIGRIGRPPPISLARTRENVVTASPMPGGTLPANDRAAFMSRHERDAILDFIDPCAFWGSFFQSHVSAHGAAGLGTKVDGADVYTKVLAGPAANFVNRNTAYIDVRDDHGHSMNYYRATGDEILLVIGADPDPSPVDYYGANNWPSFSIPAASLPTTASGNAAAVQLALPAADASAAVTYVSAGYAIARGEISALAGADRFLTEPRLTTGFPASSALAAPLAQTDAGARLHASYQKLHQFRRGPIADEAATPSPAIPSPFYRRATDNIFPIGGADPFPRLRAGCTIRTHADLFFLVSQDGLPAVVARPGVAHDADNLYLFLLPVDFLYPDGRSPPDAERLNAPVRPAFEELSVRYFRPDILLDSGDRLGTRTIQPVQNVAVELMFEQLPPLDNTELSANFWAIAMSDADFAAAVQAQSAALPGTAVLSLGAPTAGSDKYEEVSSNLSYLQSPAPTASSMTRVTGAPFKTLYRNASV